MKKEKRGPHADPAETQAYIKAALKLHGKQSLHKIMLLTGYHFATVKAHVLRLIDEGVIERVQKKEYEYQLAEEKGEIQLKR